MKESKMLKKFLDMTLSQLNAHLDANGGINIKSFVQAEMANYNLDQETYDEIMLFVRAVHTQTNLRWKFIQDYQAQHNEEEKEEES